MDERELLILGLLTVQSQHGYQINDFIDKNLNRVSDMKKATAYSILKRLNKSGFVAVTEEKEGNRPVRQVYSITPKGKTRFQSQLAESLGHMELVLPVGDISLLFVDHLPKGDVVRLLKLRLAKIEQYIEQYKAAPSHGQDSGIDLSIRHQIALLNCDRDWLEETITNFSRQLEEAERLDGET